MPMKLFEESRHGEKDPKEVLKDQVRIKSDLREIKIGGKNSADQKNTTKKVSKLFDWREKIINFFRDGSLLLSEAKYETKYGEELKISTANQMFQRLPIALAQVKAGNNSKNLLNEIRQIVYYLYQSKINY